MKGKKLANWSLKENMQLSVKKSVGKHRGEHKRMKLHNYHRLGKQWW